MRPPSHATSRAWRHCRSHLKIAALFSAVVNLLYLTPSIFMLQVYDRVIPTSGTTTLALLCIPALTGLAALALLDWLRSRVLTKASVHLDAQLAGPLLAAVMTRPALSRAERAEAIREFDSIRNVITSGAALAILDAPWTPIYLLTACLVHPLIGLFTLGCGGVLLLLAWSNERATHRLYEEASTVSTLAYARQGHMTSYASEIRALGMGDALRAQALDERARANSALMRATFASQRHGALIKFFRLAAQSAVLAIAALLAISGSISAGAIFATTLLLGRALAPIEQIVGSWKAIIKARSAYLHLSTLLEEAPRSTPAFLPTPAGLVEVEGITVATPQQDRVALADVRFTITPGEIVAVAGMSGAGKSTLLRALVGAVEPVRGTVRLDSASLNDWNPRQLSNHIGYMPQEFVLFAGTVRDNIARFQTRISDDPAAVDRAVIAAAQRIGAHEMILKLPSGYDMVIGHGGVGLSAGQAQRIALARALYAEPAFIVLDEPSANLDAEAKTALLHLIASLRQARITTVFASHDADLLGAADKLALLTAGRLTRFGTMRPATPSDIITRLSA